MSFVICIPEGGLNDILCQIQKCIDYCIRFNRSLILDTQAAGIFSDDWNHYFRFRLNQPEIVTDCGTIQEIKKSIKPYDVGHQKIYDSLRNNSVDFSDEINFHFRGCQLTFNFSTDHPEKILLHHQCGGGHASQQILKQLCLQPHLAAKLHLKLTPLPLLYDAIHCRNTDMKSDLQEFKIPKTKRSFFLSTDSKSAKLHFRETIRNSKVFFSDTELCGDLPLHSAFSSTDQKRVANESAILDLIALGLALNFYATNPASGYSALAKFLNTNPQFVLKMLSGTGVSFRVRARAMLCILHKTFARFQPVKEKPSMA